MCRQPYKGRIADAAEGFVIVDADHGDLLGNAASGAAAGIEQLTAALGTADHDADGVGEVREPVGELVLMGIPGGVGEVVAGFIADGDGVPGSGDL